MASSSTKVFPDPVVLPPTMFFSGKENSGPCAHPRSPQHEDSVFKSTLANGVSNSGPTATPTSPSPSPPTSRRPSSSSSSYLDLKRRLKAQEAVVTHIKLHARTNKGGQQDVLRVQRNQLPKLPRRLPRVPTLFIPRENILAVDVSLEMVPADYILYKLESTYIRCDSDAGSSDSSSATNGTILMGCDPTHILALHCSLPRYFQRSKTHGRRILLHPVHSLVLAAHCAKLPSLPSSAKSSDGSIDSLPVVPIRVPSPEAFVFLDRWLYTHDNERLVKTLLHPQQHRASGDAELDDFYMHHPLPTTLSALTSAALELHAAFLASRAVSLLRLKQHAGFLQAFWANLHALGVSDDSLSETLDVAWEIILAALILRTCRI